MAKSVGQWPDTGQSSSSGRGSRGATLTAAPDSASRADVNTPFLGEENRNASVTAGRGRFRVLHRQSRGSFTVVNVQLLSDVITALEMITKGRKPESLHALAAGFGLDCLSHEEALGEL